MWWWWWWWWWQWQPVTWSSASRANVALNASPQNSANALTESEPSLPTTSFAPLRVARRPYCTIWRCAAIADGSPPSSMDGSGTGVAAARFTNAATAASAAATWAATAA